VLLDVLLLDVVDGVVVTAVVGAALSLA